MLSTLKLLLPALMPSWNFFEDVAPSPRVEYRLLDAEEQPSDDWCTFRPKPETVSFATMMRRMVWNPRWNEGLFVVSCSERLQNQQTPQHSEDEIFRRIARDLTREGTAPDKLLQFRLIFIYREDETLNSEITFESSPRPLSEAHTS